MSKNIASNDNYIELVINDSNYDIRSSGEIYTLVQKTGKVSICGNWRIAGYNRDGYRRITYKRKVLAVHRIVYRKFLGQLDQQLMINHKDGNSLNNDISNLELTNNSGNQLHRYRVMGRGPVKGNAKVDQKIADEIRDLYSTGNFSLKDLAKIYKIVKSIVSYIVNNRTWVK